MSNKFTSKRIQEITDLKINTLHYYVQAGAIIPDIDLGMGTGKSRKFSATNCMEAKIIKAFIQYGIPRRINVDILKKIRKNRERDRLDPEKIWERTTTEYLLISHGGKENPYFNYRFISDGGAEYAMSRKEWKSRIGLTSYNELEFIADFLTVTRPVSIVINLSIFALGVPMNNKLISKK